MMSDFDPYTELMEVIRFCNQADQHIATLIANQEVIINQLNQLRDDLSAVEQKLFDIELEDLLKENDSQN
jgi:hypothetical protein